VHHATHAGSGWSVVPTEVLYELTGVRYAEPEMLAVDCAELLERNTLVKARVIARRDPNEVEHDTIGNKAAGGVSPTLPRISPHV
jgi:hypothetical protein